MRRTLAFKILFGFETYCVKGITKRRQLREKKWFSSLLWTFNYCAHVFSGLPHVMFIEHCLFLKIDMYYPIWTLLKNLMGLVRQYNIYFTDEFGEEEEKLNSWAWTRNRIFDSHHCARLSSMHCTECASAYWKLHCQKSRTELSEVVAMGHIGPVSTWNMASPNWDDL